MQILRTFSNNHKTIKNHHVEPDLFPKSVAETHFESNETIKTIKKNTDYHLISEMIIYLTGEIATTSWEKYEIVDTCLY